MSCNYNYDRSYSTSSSGIEWENSVKTEVVGSSTTKLSAVMGGDLAVIFPTSCNKYKFGDTEMTALELIVQINKNFPTACIPPDAIIVYGKLYLKRQDCCDFGKCIGTVINFINPSKKACDCHSLVGELWSFIAMIDRQLLLHSTETEDHSCASFEIRERCTKVHMCTSGDETSFVTHVVSGPVEVLAACKKYRGTTGCGIVSGFLGFDREFTNCRFWKQLANRCNVPDCGGDYTPFTFPITFNYEICLVRNCVD